MAHRITYLYKETKTIQRIKGLLIGLIFPLFLTAQCAHPDDYKALRSLYLTTDGDNWTKKLGWPNRTFFVNNTNIPPNIDMSNWFGITCSNDRVIKVSLPKNNLKGVLSNFPLAELETLILDENELQGNIPNFNLTKLETLSLRSNKFFGNIPIFNFLSLKSLDLSYNNLTGPMPSFENMSELLTLKLDHNKLTGNVPNFNLPKLENLEIQFNQLNGSIPTLNLPKIINLIMDGNNFTGKIPNFNFSNLIKLSLSMNSLFGEIPALELPMLQELNLNNNKLSGNIPTFQSPNLQTLNLSSNQLSGIIPNFSYNNLFLLYLNDNNLSGCIPLGFKKYCDSIIINDPIMGQIKIKPEINLSQNYRLPWFGDFNSFCNSNGTINSQIGANCGNCSNKIIIDSNDNCTCQDDNFLENKLEGFVFVDLNIDGSIDSEDAPLEGISIAAYPNCDKSNLPLLTTTDKNGYYKFDSWQLQIQSFNYLVTIDPNSTIGCETNLAECIEVNPCTQERFNVIFPCPPPNCVENPYSYGNNCDAAFENPLCDLRVIGEFPCGQNPSELGPWNNQQHCQGTFKNTSFYGFIAGSGDYNIEFTVFNCAGKGLQYGIMDACSPEGPFVLCSSVPVMNGYTVTFHLAF